MRWYNSSALNLNNWEAIAILSRLRSTDFPNLGKVNGVGQVSSMPTLKHITCSIQWADTGAPFTEYGTVYGDGVVETFIVVPNKPQLFTINLASTSFIYQGLSIIVFTDGNYQANRNRVNILPPTGGARQSIVSFVIRQKERPIKAGMYLGREWRFDDHNIVPETPEDVKKSHFEDLGTIEVLVLRCRRPSRRDGPSSPVSSGADSDIFNDRNETFETTEHKNMTTLVTAKTVSEDDGDLGGLFGLFDGASDFPQHPAHGHGRSTPCRNPSSSAFPQHRTGPSTSSPFRDRGSTSQQSWHPNWTNQQHPQDRRREKHVHFDFGPIGPPPDLHQTREDPVGFRPASYDRHRPDREDTSRGRAHYNTDPAHLVNQAPHPQPMSYTLCDPHTLYQPKSYLPEYAPTLVPIQNAIPLPSIQHYGTSLPFQLHYPNYHNYYGRAWPHQETDRYWQAMPHATTQAMGVSAMPPPQYSYPSISHDPNGRQPPTGTYEPRSAFPVASNDGIPSTAHAAFNTPQLPSQAINYGYNGPTNSSQTNSQFATASQDWGSAAVHNNKGKQWSSGTSDFDAVTAGSVNDQNKVNDVDTNADGSFSGAWENGQGNINGTGDDWSKTSTHQVDHNNKDVSNDWNTSGNTSGDSWSNKQPGNTSTNVNDNNDNQGGDDWGGSKSNAGDWQTPNDNNNNQGANDWGPSNSNIGGQEISNDNNNWNQGGNTTDTLQQKYTARTSVRPLFGPHGQYYTWTPQGPNEPPADAEEEPRYDVPKTIADARDSSKQVQPGRGYLYFKKSSRPEYIDSMEEPYARFVFKYRTKEQLKKETGIEIDMEPTGDESLQTLQNLDKGALIELLTRAQNALGGKIPGPASAPISIAKETTTDKPHVPTAVDAPIQSFLKYLIPPPRTSGLLDTSTPGSHSANTANDTQRTVDWGGNQATNNSWADETTQQAANRDWNNTSQASNHGDDAAVINQSNSSHKRNGEQDWLPSILGVQKETQDTQTQPEKSWSQTASDLAFDGNAANGSPVSSTVTSGTGRPPWHDPPWPPSPPMSRHSVNASNGVWS